LVRASNARQLPLKNTGTTSRTRYYGVELNAQKIHAFAAKDLIANRVIHVLSPAETPICAEGILGRPSPIGEWEARSGRASYAYVHQGRGRGEDVCRGWLIDKRALEPRALCQVMRHLRQRISRRIR